MAIFGCLLLVSCSNLTAPQGAEEAHATTDKVAVPTDGVAVTPIEYSSDLEAAAARARDERPNILLLVGDDMAFGDIGPFGSEIETTALDALAKAGLKFSNFHATPVCSVTRGELLTGNNNIEIGLASFDYAVYPEAVGKPGYEGYLTRTTATIAELLQDAGYNTYHTGKWHLGGEHGGDGPHLWGFTHSYGIYSGGSNHWNQEDMLPNPIKPEVKSAIAKGEIPPITRTDFQEDGVAVDRPMGIYSDDLYTGKMLQYLEESRRQGKPFFGYLAFTTAHLPIHAPLDRIERNIEHYYQLGFEGLKKDRFERLKRAGIIPEEAKFPKKNAITETWASLSEEKKREFARIFATYAAMIESQDRHIGKLLDYLRETGQRDNTLIIYMTDNGPEGAGEFGKLSNPSVNAWLKARFSSNVEDIGKGNTNHQIGLNWANAATGALSWWKWFIGEGGIRVPLIISPPRAIDGKLEGSGSLNQELFSVKDLPATILDYAGVTPPSEEYRGRAITAASGISMRQVLRGEDVANRDQDDWIAFELFGNTYVMQGDRKAIRLRTGMWGDGEWHLFDLKNDPGETTPLEGSERETLDRMIAIYQAYAQERSIQPVREDWNPYDALGK
jgi:arylsulfatase A-like enzyme